MKVEKYVIQIEKDDDETGQLKILGCVSDLSDLTTEGKLSVKYVPFIGDECDDLRYHKQIHSWFSKTGARNYLADLVAAIKKSSHSDKLTMLHFTIVRKYLHQFDEE